MYAAAPAPLWHLTGKSKAGKKAGTAAGCETARLEAALVGSMQGNGKTVSDAVELLLRDE
jgi:hypothetical protein